LRNIISTQDKRRLVTVNDDNNDRYIRPLCAAVTVLFTNFDIAEGFGVCPAKLVFECNLGITGYTPNIRKKFLPQENRAQNHYKIDNINIKIWKLLTF